MVVVMVCSFEVGMAHGGGVTYLWRCTAHTYLWEGGKGREGGMAMPAY